MTQHAKTHRKINSFAWQRGDYGRPKNTAQYLVDTRQKKGNLRKEEAKKPERFLGRDESQCSEKCHYKQMLSH